MYGCVNWWNIVGFGIQTNEHLDSPCQILQKFNHVTVLDIFICFTTTRLYSTFRTRYSFTAWITQSSINPLIYSYCMIEFPNNWVCFIRGLPLMRCILDYIYFYRSQIYLRWIFRISLYLLMKCNIEISEWKLYCFP